MRVLFMGTPDFAAVSLQALYEAKFEIVGVFTQPDKPQGRKKIIVDTPTKACAMNLGIPIFQPVSLRDAEVEAIIRNLRPDLFAVVAYGKIIPPGLLSIPPLGAVNVHGSILPQYRGAAPIQWSVLNGDCVTGVTTMYLDEKMDTGDIIYCEKTNIGETETSEELFRRLSKIGAKLLVRTLKDIEAGKAPRYKQDENMASYAPPLTKALCPIDFEKSDRMVMKHICGLIPWPIATMQIGDKTLKVYEAEFTDQFSESRPGTLLGVDSIGLSVACGNKKIIKITKMQAPGGKVMKAADYFRGHPLELSDG